MPKRPTKYIVVQHGMPYTANEMPPRIERLTRADIMQEIWTASHVFDSSYHYCYETPTIPTFSPAARLLARTIYNPSVSIQTEWDRIGNYSADALIAAVDRGLQHDDDIIQQWFGAGDVLELLCAADSWDKMLLAVEAVGGSHEVYPDVARYVESVFGDL